MSLLPFDFHFSRPVQSLFDQSFGEVLDDFYADVPSVFRPTGYFRPWRYNSAPDSGVSKVINDKDKYEVSLDVKQFKAEEIIARNVDNMIIIEGRHEERQDEHGYVSRHFVRRYVLPKDVDVEKCKVQISSDGVLNISVPKKMLMPASAKAGRNIPITITQPGVAASTAAKAP